MAKSMINETERQGHLRSGMTVVEATGGSTGSSLSFVCAVKRYPFHVVSSNAFSVEKLRTMTAFGANLDLIHTPTGKVTPDLIPSMIRRAEEVSEAKDYYFTNQFKNRAALLGYETIGHELVQQFPEGIDLFCGAVGTAGMMMGVARALKEKWPETHVAVLEPASSPTITESRPGTHHVEGIGIGYIPPHLDRQLYDEALRILEHDGRSMCCRLAKEEGLLVGTSTGLNVVAAIKLAKEIGPDRTVVTVAADTGLKYLNGSLFANG